MGSRRPSHSAATACLFAAAGARGVVTFGSGAEVANRPIASLPGSAIEPAAIESLTAAIGTSEGRLDILVDNAGSTPVIPHADLRALDDDFFDFALAINLRGPFAMVRASQLLLKESGRGPVVNVGSVAGVRGGSSIAYAATQGSRNCPPAWPTSLPLTGSRSASASPISSS